MRVVADLHVHSKYSRATSRDLSPEGLGEGASTKGVDVIGTGDFTHPEYLRELKDKLKESPLSAGFFMLKGDKVGKNPLFMLTQEISCIYSQGGKMRRNHIVITAPDFKTVDRLVEKLGSIGNLASDGRPILGLSSRNLVEIVLDANDDNLIIPAHIWTPWFSTFGSKSGYDSIAECFQDMTKHICAIETGLSSDPPMNWRVSQLDSFAIVSNGDAHSAGKIAREATVFELRELTYKNLFSALKNSVKIDKSDLPADRIEYTIEFYPEEGKYHWDGHRACDVSFKPEETKKHNGLCPRCRKPLTVGVESRVEALADRSVDEAKSYGQKHRPSFKKLVPLQEIVADALGQGSATKKVVENYRELIKKGISELNILLYLPKSDLQSIAPAEIVEGVIRVREERIAVEPGYDGVFGHVRVFTEKERLSLAGKQTRLF